MASITWLTATWESTIEEEEKDAGGGEGDGDKDGTKGKMTTWVLQASSR